MWLCSVTCYRAKYLVSRSDWMGNAGSEHQDSYQGSSSNRHPSIPEHKKNIHQIQQHWNVWLLKRQTDYTHTASKHNNTITQLGSAKGTRYTHHVHLPLGNEERTYNTEQRHVLAHLAKALLAHINANNSVINNKVNLFSKSNVL